MELGCDRDEILGDIAEDLRAEQGDGFKKTLFYKIQDKAGHTLTTSAHWYDADNGLGHYEWLTLVKIFGLAFANHSLARLGYKVVPLASAKVDAEALKAEVDRGIEILTSVSHEIGTAIDNGGDKREDAA